MDRESGSSAEGAGSDEGSRLGRGMAAAAVLIMLGNLLSRVLGMVREQLASGLFGTGDPIAAFQIADNVQSLLFDLVMSGMLEAALVPVLVQWASADAAARRELRHVSGALLTLAVIVIGGATALGVAFAPFVVRVMTGLGGGETRDAATTELTVTLVRIILPAVVFLAAGTVMMSVLYAMNRVAAPALGLTARNAAVVVAMLALQGAYGVKSMAIGTVIGAALVAAIQLPALIKLGVLPRPNLDLRHPGVRQVIRLQMPIFAGLVVSTTAVIVDRNLAWRAQEDALGAMRYATTLVQFVLGIVAAAIALAALPALAGHFTRGDEASFRDALERALAMVTVLIVPATLGMAALARPVIDLLFHHGETDRTGAHLIVIALLGYLPGTVCAAYDQVLIYAFYARRNTLWPVTVGVAATMVYFAVALTAGRHYGMMGLVLANSAQFAVHVAVMVLLTRRTVGSIWTPRLIRAIQVSALAGAAMAIVAGAGWLALRAAWNAPVGTAAAVMREFALVVVPAASGAAIYVVLLYRWRVEELAMVRRATLGRFVARFGG